MVVSACFRLTPAVAGFFLTAELTLFEAAPEPAEELAGVGVLTGVSISEGVAGSPVLEVTDMDRTGREAAFLGAPAPAAGVPNLG